MASAWLKCVAKARHCRLPFSRGLASGVKEAPSTYNQQKSELFAKRIANDNPFDAYTLKPDAIAGLNKDCPIVIPSMKASRVIGCCCESDYDGIVWFELKKEDGVRQCDCGFFFKLIDYDPLDPKVRPTLGQEFGSGLNKIY